MVANSPLQSHFAGRAQPIRRSRMTQRRKKPLELFATRVRFVAQSCRSRQRLQHYVCNVAARGRILICQPLIPAYGSRDASRAMCWNKRCPRRVASSKWLGPATFAVTMSCPGRMNVSSRIVSSSRAHARRIPSANSESPYHRSGPIQLPRSAWTSPLRSRFAGKYVWRIVTPGSSGRWLPGLKTWSALGVTRYPTSVRSGRQRTVADDGAAADRDRRAAQARAEVEVGLVLPARHLVVRAHGDVHVPRNDRVLEEPGPGPRIQPDVEVPEQVLRPFRLLPVRAEKVLVLRGGELRHPAAIESDPHVADPATEPGDRSVEHDRPFARLLVGHDERLARGEVRHVLALVEVLLRDDAVLDPGRSSDEVARELGAVRMRDLEAAFAREGPRDLPPGPDDLATVHGARIEDHRPPGRQVEPVCTCTRLGDVAEAESRTAEPGPLRPAVPFVVVRRRGAVLLAGLPDLRDVRGARDEDVAVRLAHRLPLVAPHLSELRFRERLDGPPIGVLVLEDEHRTRAGRTYLVDDFGRDREPVVPRFYDHVLFRLDLQRPSDDVLREGFVLGHGRLSPRTREVARG